MRRQFRMRRHVKAAIAACAATLALGAAPAAQAAPLDTVQGWDSALTIVVGWEASGEVPAQPADLTPAQLGATIDTDVNPWFEAASRGQFHGIDADDSSAGPYTIRNPGSCDSIGFRERVADSAEAVADADGYDPGDFDHVIVYFSRTGCNWEGESVVGGKRVWLNGRTELGKTIVHELGHNFGLNHSELLECIDGNGNPVTLSDLCRITSYGDGYSSMSGGRGAYAASQQWSIGWMNQRRLDLSIGDTAAHLFLQPLESSGLTTQAVQLQDGGKSYWVEYRAGTGIDAPGTDGLPAPGVLIRQAGPLGPMQSRLLDLSPATGVRDAGLLAGRSWENPLGTVRYTVNSISALGAELTIESKYVPVPNVIGLDRQSASSSITRAGYVVGTVRSVVDGSCNYLNTVMEQIPGAGRRFPAGTAINLTLGLRPSGGCQ